MELKKLLKKYDCSQPIKYDDSYMKKLNLTQMIIFHKSNYLFYYNNYNNEICNTKRP